MTPYPPYGSRNLDRHIQAAQTRLKQLNQQSQGRQDLLLSRAIVDLSIALEELWVTSEEVQEKQSHVLLMRDGLAEERQRYKTLFDCAPDPYVVTDPSGMIQAVNYMAAALVKQRSDFLIGKPIVLLFSQPDHALIYQKLTQIRQYQPTPTTEDLSPPYLLQNWPIPPPIIFWQDQSLTLQFREQQPAIPITLSLSAELDDQGQVVRLLWLCRDVSRQPQGDTPIKALLEELQSLYDYAPCGYHSLDAEGRLTRINETELRWLGYEPDQLIGSCWRDRLTPESQQRFDQALLGQQQQGYIRDLGLDLQAKNGQILSVSFSSTATKSESGEVVISRSVVVDISDRRQQTATIAQQSETIAQQAALLDLAADGLWAQDLNHCICLWNHGAEQLYGWSQAQALGQSALTLLHPDPEYLDQIWDVLMKDGTWAGELEQITRTNGSLRVWSRWSLIKAASGQPQSILVANRAIAGVKD
jgi:PAS domain S-box-containing protein